MTPRQKALEMRNKFRIYNGQIFDDEFGLVNNYSVAKHVAKKSALIAIEYILEIENTKYWQDVKFALENDII